MRLNKKTRLVMLTRWYRKATSLYEKELLLKLIRFYQSN
nr:MAG TPA: hypothetical protein [Bacteriophage sp.]